MKKLIRTEIYEDEYFRYHTKGDECYVEAINTSIEVAVIPSDYEGYKVIGVLEYGFENCKELKEVTLPDTLLVLETGAFKNCVNLKSIRLSNNLKEIGDDCFFQCFKLEELYIPNTVVCLGVGFVNNCQSLNTLVVENGNPYFDSRNGCNCVIDSKENILLIGCNNSVIPDSIDRIGDFAFSNCEHLKDVKLPENLRKIGMYAFSSCKSLEHIIIPRKVKSIGECAFLSCPNLKVTLLSNDVYLEENAISRHQMDDYAN